MKQTLSTFLLASLLFACQSSKKLAKNNIIQDSHWKVYDLKIKNDQKEQVGKALHEVIAYQVFDQAIIQIQDSIFYIQSQQDKIDAKIIARQADFLLLYDPKEQKEIKFPYELDVKNKKCVFHFPGFDGQGEILLYSEQIPMP